MSHYSEVTAEALESAFGDVGGAGRFANFCNAVLVAESTGPLPSIPILSEKPGADGGFDGEWDLRSVGTGFSNPFAESGWNVFQFKARGITGSGRRKAVSDLKNNLKGVLGGLVARMKAPKELRRYTLFTNLQLGLETQSTTGGGAVISKDRTEIEDAVREEITSQTTVHILDAAQLAALVNKHPALRLTYFTPSVARAWDEKWQEEQAAKNYKVSVPLIGREKQIEQLKEWMTDPTVRVIAICGPSGMGKTRLALEATRPEQFRTTVVDVVEELERLGVKSLGSSPQTRLIIVEDPTEIQATRLTKEALTTAGVKLIFTFPSEAKTPKLKLTEHESVKQIVLERLDPESSRKLLESAHAALDDTAREWVIRQAGGVPEILLSAAELGPSLRDKSGDLKTRLAGAYRKRIENELGVAAIGILRVLSPLHWVKVFGGGSDLPELISTIGAHMDAISVLTQVKSLQAMGYLRRRGDYVSVVPPLFAAALAEELFAAGVPGICLLFDRLSDPSRNRLLERVVTVDLTERSPFWEHVFESALGTTERLIANLDLLDYLSRAIPLRTAQFLENQISALADWLGADKHNWKRGSLLRTVRELVYQQESCGAGMRLLQTLALNEPWQEEARSATKLFCECLVHWHAEFPLSYQDRERWIRRMLGSENVNERRLAARIVVIVTQPPRTLSAYTVSARRLGQAPPMRLNQELWDYIDHFLELRFDLVADQDSAVSALAQEHFVHVFQDQILPADRHVVGLKKFMERYREGKLREDEREIRQVLGSVERRFSEASKKPGQAGYADKWSAVLQEIAVLRKQFDDGPFVIRLKVGLGRASDHSWEEVDGKREYAFEKRCRILAHEAVEKPELMIDAAWRLLRDPKSFQAYTFIISLGASDRTAGFLSRFCGDATDESGSQNLGLYLAGLQQHSPALVDAQLDGLNANPAFPKTRLLKPLALTGPTPTNRHLLLRLIGNRAVEPFDVGQMLMPGRWLDSLPQSEVRLILEFIATGPTDGKRLIVHIISLYLYPEKPLPAELIPIAEQALRGIDTVDDGIDWDCGRVAVGIARTDMGKAFKLLRNQIDLFKNMSRLARSLPDMWMPLHSDRSSDFWEFLRNHSPEKAYRELLALHGAEFTSELGLLLDLEGHRDVSLDTANGDQVSALLYANLVSGGQPGFFPFAYGLMQAFPNDEQISIRLASAATYGLGFGYGEVDYSQALDRIETELRSTTTPPQFVVWLQCIKERINAALKSSHVVTQEADHLDWD